MNFVSIRLLLISIHVAKVVQFFGETKNSNFRYFIVMHFLLPCSFDKYATFDITCIYWRHDNLFMIWISNELLFMTFLNESRVNSHLHVHIHVTVLYKYDFQMCSGTDWTMIFLYWLIDCILVHVLFENISLK